MAGAHRGLRIDKLDKTRSMTVLSETDVRALHFVIIAGVPFIVAATAAVLYPFWVLGIPGTSTAEYAQGRFLGLVAISLYVPAYGIGVVGLLFARLMNWPIGGPLHGLVWPCTAIFLVAMATAIAIMQ